MTDGEFFTWVREVNEIGGPIAAAVLILGAAWLRFIRPNRGGGTERQMADALDRLATKVDDHHAKAEDHHAKAEGHREEIKDGMAALAERVARIEGRMEAKR